MGLDMYLYRKNESGECIEVGYWRKANMIHRWMVENVQGGKDDCGEYVITVAQMKALRKVIKGIMLKGGESRELKAREKLPTQSGFFFGGVEYDKGYYVDLKYTLGILNGAIWKGIDCYYSSSW